MKAKNRSVFPIKNKNFSLTENAFHILKATYRSGRSDLSELVEDAEFDELFDTDSIHRAQQSLLAPIARLEQELSWLPELSHVQISNVIEFIASRDVGGLKQFSEHLPELAKANVLAHLIGAKSITVDTCHSLVAPWDELDKNSILEVINNDRSEAGFPGIEPQQLDSALQDLEILHANTAAVGVWTLDRPGEEMERIVETEIKRHPTSSFLERFVRSYDSLSEPALVRISNEIDDFIELAKSSDGDLNVLVGAISDLLVKWDDINQPVQVYEQHQGHEEGRSKRIYEKLQTLCLELANDHGESSEARRLSEALLRTFPELESVAEVLKRDVAQLETLDEQQKQHQHVEPLIAACGAAKNQMPKVAKVLARYGFSQTSKGPVSDILVAFKAALSAMEVRLRHPLST